MTNNVVENPIINDPFSEPSEHWVFGEGPPRREPGRRSAGYYFRPRSRAAGGAVAAEEFASLELVNSIRERVKQWREAGYPGVTRTTLALLHHWSSGDRERRLFFCQREAAETVIWLVESTESARAGLTIPKDEPVDQPSLVKGLRSLSRFGCKMATGSGKTVLMAMLAAWSVLNKVESPQDRRFSDAILVVCPNLTVLERLQVLLPGAGSYYEKFDLVPPSLLALLTRGRFFVTNWHVFAPDDDARSHSVVQRGAESDKAFSNRVLKELGSKQNILVLNDEAHHAYRPALAREFEQLEKEDLSGEERDHLESELGVSGLSAEERRLAREEEEEATVWVSGLDRINAARGINFCVDMSATPFYLKGSGHPEGMPLPWLVSDFGLVDAIESGIVKIPRMPVDDNSGRLIPDYFYLWRTVMDRLPPSERATGRRRAKPEAILRQSEGALATLASQWKKTFDGFKKAGQSIPPALIVVCDNTDLAELLVDHIGKKGNVLPDLKNKDDATRTLRIDSRLLDKAESALEGETREEAAERLRRTVNTVGKIGEPGEQIRCVVSVAMLTEGWDAQNVTQILGLRAFDSQLLCEQVLGRGLRRLNYDDLTAPEYVDVYGIPFEVIPVKRGSLKGANPPPVSTLVQALPDRQALEIIFPRVEGFVYDVQQRVRANVASIPRITIEASKEPTEIVSKDGIGLRGLAAGRLGPGREVIQDRAEFYAKQRLQAVIYDISAEVTKDLGQNPKTTLFPQVLQIVKDFVDTRIEVQPDARIEDLALQRYRNQVVERLRAAIEPENDRGEPALLPIIEKFRPTGSTRQVMFRTIKTCHPTTKSHVSQVVTDNHSWEHLAAFELEKMPEVTSYVKNDHLGFEIRYEFEGQSHPYIPDYLVKWERKDSQAGNLIIEVKGFETEKDRAKEVSANRWVSAVNHHGGFGRWNYLVCKEPRALPVLVRRLIGREPGK